MPRTRLKFNVLLSALALPLFWGASREPLNHFCQAPLTTIARNDTLGILAPLLWSLDLSVGQQQAIENLLSQEQPRLQILADEMNSAKFAAMAVEEDDLLSIRRRREFTRAREALNRAQQALEQRLRAKLDETQLAKLERSEIQPDTPEARGIIAIAVLWLSKDRRA